MTAIGTLAVNITAVTEPLVKGLNFARNKFSGFVSELTSATNIIGGVGLAAMAAFTQQTVAAVDALGDLADNLSISAEALQALDYASVQLGGSTEALHAGLHKMKQLLGDAAKGSDSAIGSFNQLHLDFRQLLELPVEAQFLAIVDALNSIDDKSTRAAMAQDIFGKGSKELNAIINSGTAEIVKFSDELARMNGILSNESVKSMGEAQQSFDKFGTLLNAQKNQLVASYADEIPLAVNSVIWTIKTMRAVMLEGSAAIIMGMNVVVKSIRGAVDALNQLLPQSMEISTQSLDSYVDTFDAKIKDLRTKAVDIMLGRGDEGPLKPTDMARVAGTAPTTKGAKGEATAEEKATAANTKKTNDQLAEMVQLMRQGYSQNEAYVKVAGVR